MLNRVTAEQALGVPFSPKLGVAILLSLAVLSWVGVIRLVQLVVG